MAFSFSQFRDYDICPRRYKLKYVDKIFSEPTEALSKGIKAHQNIDEAINGAITKSHLPSGVRFDLPTLTVSSNSPFTMSLYDISIPSRVIATPNETYIIASEVKLCVDRSGKPTDWTHGFFRGILDCIVAYDVTCWSRAGKIYLYDWKTGSSTGSKRQLESYMYLLHRHFEGIDIEGYFVYLDQDRVSRPIINISYDAVWKNIENSSQKIEDDNTYLPRSNFWCKNCPGLADCSEKMRGVLNPFGSFETLMKERSYTMKPKQKNTTKNITEDVLPEEVGSEEEYIQEDEQEDEQEEVKVNVEGNAIGSVEENLETSLPFYPVPAEDVKLSMDYFIKKTLPEIRYESDFLPILKLDHKTFEIVVVDAPQVVPPVYFTCLGIRNMSRKLIGSKYECRCYEGGASHNNYIMTEENGGVFGLSALVWTSYPGYEKIVGLEIFGTSGQVWAKWLENATIQSKKMRKLDKMSFMDCSKENEKGRFIKPGKVTRGELITIDEKGIGHILECAGRQKKQIEHFFSR